MKKFIKIIFIVMLSCVIFKPQSLRADNTNTFNSDMNIAAQQFNQNFGCILKNGLQVGVLSYVAAIHIAPPRSNYKKIDTAVSLGSLMMYLMIANKSNGLGSILEFTSHGLVAGLCSSICKTKVQKALSIVSLLVGYMVLPPGELKVVYLLTSLACLLCSTIVGAYIPIPNLN